MEGHNRPYPSLKWAGMDDKQIVWMSGSYVGSAYSEAKVCPDGWRFGVPPSWP